jgi:ribose transport system substrate-binding protein
VKKVLLWSLVLIMVVFLIGCSLLAGCKTSTAETTAASTTAASTTAAATTAAAETTAAAKQLPDVIRIGWAPSGVTGVFKMALDFSDKAIAEAKKEGFNIEVTVKAMPSEMEFAEQVKAIEAFVASEMDAIIICPSSNMETIKPAVKIATDKGIPVIIVNLLEKQEGMDISSYIGFSNSDAGAVNGYAMLDYLGGPGVLGKGDKVDVPADTFLDLAKWEEIFKDFDYSTITGNVAIVEGIAGGFYSEERKKGLLSVLDKCPNLKIVATLPGDWDRQKAVAAAENILQSNPELDAITAFSTEMGLGLGIAVKNMNRPEVATFSQDGTPESLEAIKAGTMMAETWHGFPEWGWYGAEFAVKLALGQEVPAVFDCRPRTEYAGNIDSFYPDVKLDAIDWKGIKETYLNSK